MNCQESRDAVGKLHKNPTDHDVVWGNETKDGLLHMQFCETCPAWFEANICSYVEGLPQQDFEEVELLHGMVHNQVGVDDCDPIKQDK